LINLVVHVGDVPGARGTGYKRAYIRSPGCATYIEKRNKLRCVGRARQSVL